MYVQFTYCVCRVIATCFIFKNEIWQKRMPLKLWTYYYKYLKSSCLKVISENTDLKNLTNWICFLLKYIFCFCRIPLLGCFSGICKKTSGWLLDTGFFSKRKCFVKKLSNRETSLKNLSPTQFWENFAFLSWQKYVLGARLNQIILLYFDNKFSRKKIRKNWKFQQHAIENPDTRPQKRWYSTFILDLLDAED